MLCNDEFFYIAADIYYIGLCNRCCDYFVVNVNTAVYVRFFKKYRYHNHKYQITAQGSHNRRQFTHISITLSDVTKSNISIFRHTYNYFVTLSLFCTKSMPYYHKSFYNRKNGSNFAVDLRIVNLITNI